MVSVKDVGVVIHVCIYMCSSTSQEGGVEEVVLSPLDQLVCRRVVSFVSSVVIMYLKWRSYSHVWVALFNC